MAHFYASISGKAKSIGTREGTAQSGISGHIRGWNLGVSIDGHIENRNGKETDCFKINITGGSNDSFYQRSFGIYRDDQDNIIFVDHSTNKEGRLFKAKISWEK